MSKLKITWYNKKQDGNWSHNGDFALAQNPEAKTELEALVKKASFILAENEKASLAITNEAFSTPVVIIGGKLITSPSWALTELAQLIVNHPQLTSQTGELGKTCQTVS